MTRRSPAPARTIFTPRTSPAWGWCSECRTWRLQTASGGCGWCGLELSSTGGDDRPLRTAESSRA